MSQTWQITPIDKHRVQAVQTILDRKTKPMGSLGQIEDVARQIALVQNRERLSLARPLVLIFAGDHGISKTGVSITDSHVTQQMVSNFLAGGAAINCLCRANAIDLKVIDCGIEFPLVPTPSGLIDQRINAGTQNFVEQAAMTPEECARALMLGANLARREIAAGSELLAFGEMGIGNSSAAAAILAALTGAPADDCVGLGTGISPAQLRLKTQLVAQAVARVNSTDPLIVLQELGGFEIAQMCGAMLAAAEAKTLVLVDGFIVTAAALVAARLVPAARDYMIFAHQSHETGHQLMLEELRANALLDLGLHLGEGTGAALAIPLLRAAVEMYNNMASFDSAGVVL